MELTRRRLLATLLSAGATLAVPFLPAAEGWLPHRVVAAVRAHAYPGRLRPIDMAEIRRPGRWRG